MQRYFKKMKKKIANNVTDKGLIPKIYKKLDS